MVWGEKGIATYLKLESNFLPYWYLQHGKPEWKIVR